MPKTRHVPSWPSTSRLLATGAFVDWHEHDADHVVLPLSGVLAFRTPQGSWVVPAPGHAAWIPAGTPHSHLAHRRTELRTLLLPGRAGPPLDEPTVLVVDPLFRALVRTLADEPPDDEDEYLRLVDVLLDRVRHRPVRPLHLPEPSDDRLAAVARILDATPGDTRTLDELGAAVGASGRTLSRLCGSELGLSFPLWRTQVRLGHSLVLLAEGRTVAQAAHACGWASSSAFIAVFRDFFGVTPRTYQRG